MKSGGVRAVDLFSVESQRFRCPHEGEKQKQYKLLIEVTKLVNLGQWFLNLSMHQNHLEGVSKTDCWAPSPRVSDEADFVGSEFLFLSN